MLDALEACSTAAEMLAVLDSVTPDTESLAEYLRAGALGYVEAEEVSAAAHDPAERIRIAKLAARARWRNHVKALKKKVQAQYGKYQSADGHTATLSSKFVDKGFSGTARSKSYHNGTPNLVHLHAARDIVNLWKKARFIKVENSYHAWESQSIKYGRYEAFFKKGGMKYKSLITTKNDTELGTRILYSVEVFKTKK